MFCANLPSIQNETFVLNHTNISPACNAKSNLEKANVRIHLPNILHKSVPFQGTDCFNCTKEFLAYPLIPPRNRRGTGTLILISRSNIS